MNCSKNLFNEEIQSGLLPNIAPIVKKSRTKTVQEVYNDILNYLKSQESFVFADSTSGIRYNKSIASLKDSIFGVLDRIVPKFRDDLSELKNLFDINFFADAGIAEGTIIQETEPDTPYIEGHQDLIDEDERVARKMHSVIDQFYGTVIKANNYRKQQFGLELMRAAIIDPESGSITRTNKELNIALSNLKNRYYKSIVDYLQTLGDSYATLMFGPDYKLFRDYANPLNRFYNLIKNMSQQELETKVTEGWKRALAGQSDLFYEALNSYVNLVYFDDCIEEAVGKVIQLADPNLNGLELDTSYYKYKFSKGDEHKRKGFQNSENRNALNDIAKFSRLVLSTIPIYSAADGKPLGRYVNVGNFANAITSLFVNYPKLVGKYTTIVEALLNFHSNPYYYSGIIFKEIGTNQKLQRDLINSGVNRFNMNILTSIWRAVFDTSNPKSIKSIETASFKKQFSIDGYSIIDSINGVIDRTMDATYLQLVYAGDVDMIEVTPKKKFATRKTSFNTVNKINTQNVTRVRSQRTNLANKYRLSKSDTTGTAGYDSTCKTYSVRIGDVTMVATSKSKMGVLDSKPIDLKFSNPRVNTIFDPSFAGIDLISEKNITRIINNDNLSGDEKIFRDVLEYIDSFLGTKFLTEDGLSKLYLYKLSSVSSSGNYLGSLLESAVRATVVNDMYLKFQEGLENGTYRSEFDFAEFLRNEYAPFQNIDFKNIDDTRNFFQNSLGIPELVSVRTSEDWIDQLADVEAIMTGEVSKSTTSDINGNKIANNRTSFLGGNLQYYLAKYRAAEKERIGAATTPLLFTMSPGLIVKSAFNTDALSRTGIKRSVKDMKAAELFYSSIIYNFYGNYLQADFNSRKFGRGKSDLYRTIFTLPTTYSDKTSFLMYAIRADMAISAEGKSYDGKTIWLMDSNQIVDLYMDTVGQAYVNLYNNVLDDLRRVLSLPPTADFNTIDAALHTKSESELISLALAKGVELKLDTHYRKFGKVCKFNELLFHYANDLYTDRANLARRFELEKVNFINDLIASGVSFYTNYYNDSDDVLKGKKNAAGVKQTTSNPISKIIDEMFSEEEKGIYKRSWIKNNKLILAKVNGLDIVSGAEITYTEGDVVELNPLLEKYFYTDSLLANNLRFELTGSEIAHPDKAKINYTKELQKIGITPETDPSYFTLNKDGKLEAISNFSDLVWLRNQSRIDPRLSSIYNNAILKVEAVAQGTQLKRNVIVPATLQYELQGTMNGIPARMKVAVIKDTQAKIFNFRGDFDEEDAHDGSAFINPFVSILENKALQDQEVGVDKKPIWHSFDPRTLSATLLKFATFTITNERMRTSLNSDISLYNLFKLMTNMQWFENGQWTNSRGAEIDLVTMKGLKKNQFDNIKFFTDILQSQPLFYEENGKHYQVLDFGRDEHGYYTVEAEVNLLGDRLNSEKDIKTYHMFSDADSSHLKVRDAVPPTSGFHSINSLFELFNAMGGMYSESLVEDENGKKALQYSDASSYAVVNFMNNISVRIGNDTNDLSQATYYQPLKEMMIAYAANKSAVKNGIANINGEEAWLGQTKLSYMELDTDGLGIQMDADHEIDESEMTEFSQVISALEAGGRLHHMSKQVYRTLGELAVKASEAEITTAIKYIQRVNSGLSVDDIKSELYDILGRALINNYKQNEDRTDLAAPIIAEIKRKFNLSDDHSLDEFKIPFSDSNIYGNAISTFVSNINSKSIKRKYPGSGCVMVPGYHIIQTYKYEGKVKQFDDVLKEARRANAQLHFFQDYNGTDIHVYNKGLVQAFLDFKQREAYATSSYNDVEEFIPTDIVDAILETVDAEGTVQYLKLGTFDLTDIRAYYDFKDDTKRIAQITSMNPGVNLLSGKIKYAMNITRPRDLAPARIKWKYIGADGLEHTTNIFDTAPVKDLFLSKLEKRPATYKRSDVQRIFDELLRGIYDGKPIVKGSLQNEAAELVISNMYASKFNTKGKSLAEILDKGSDFFKIGKIKPIHSKNYDLVFTTNNGKHTYITFSDIKSDGTDAFRPRNIGWKYIKPGHGGDVYATTKDGQILFKVGRNVARKDLDYINGEFINKETGQVVEDPNLRINSRGQVVEYKEFISNYLVSETGQNGKVITYNLYKVNPGNIKDSFHNSTLLDVNKQIAQILTNIYNTTNYNGIRLNYTMLSNAAKRLAGVLPMMNVGGETLKFLDKTAETYLKDIPETGVFSINKTQYDKDLKDFYNLMKEELYSSFQKSLTFTASRIPAQTLQSFMQMKAVGFTLSSKNIAYVSHWQTWLQGSDYRPEYFNLKLDLIKTYCSR